MEFRFIYGLIFALIMTSCEPKPVQTEVHKLELDHKTASPEMMESWYDYNTYLPIYSSIYVHSEKEYRQLTSTVSIHNMNLDESLIVKQIDYYGTEGDFIRSYLDVPVFIKPMETINIVVHKSDNEGGTGANFLVKWSKKNPSINDPLIEAIMISTSHQGISFSTRGIVLDIPDILLENVIRETLIVGDSIPK